METEKSVNKKVLIITYYWPPAGGPGVQRVLKFVKYLPQFGWEPVVLTVKNGEYPAIDHSLEKDIPKGIKIYRTRTIEPFRIFKFLSGKSKDDKIDTYIISRKKKSLINKISVWIRINLFIPDARIGWIPFAVFRAIKICKSNNIDIILTSSPPHSVQLIGRITSSLIKIPWIADFRDPWSEVVYYQNLHRNLISKKIDGLMEAQVFKKATRLITISNGIKKLIQDKNSNSQVDIIANGFDESSFQMGKNIMKSDKIQIVYTGVLSLERNPDILLEAFSKLPNVVKDKFEFCFYGSVNNIFLKKIKELNLNEYFNFFKYIPHQELINKLLSADCLLFVIDKVENNAGFLTGKLFDYLGAKKPILGIGPLNGDADKIILNTNSGWFVDYLDEKSFTSIMIKLTNQDYNFSFQSNDYSRLNLTKKLAYILNSTISE